MIEMEIGAIARDAREYGEHLRSGGARMGLLVARSVRSASRGRPIKGATAPFTKVTATRFAAMSGCDKNLILRHLRAWDEYVQANCDDPHGLRGLLFSHQLVPGEEIEIGAVLTEGAGTYAEATHQLPKRLRFETFYSAQVLLASPRSQTQAAAAHVGAATDLDRYRNVPGGMPREHREPVAANGFDLVEQGIRTAGNAAQVAWTAWNEMIGDGVPDQVPGDGRRPPGTLDAWCSEVLADMEAMMQPWVRLRAEMEQYGTEVAIDLREVTKAASAHG